MFGALGFGGTEPGGMELEGIGGIDVGDIGRGASALGGTAVRELRWIGSVEMELGGMELDDISSEERCLWSMRS